MLLLLDTLICSNLLPINCLSESNLILIGLCLIEISSLDRDLKNWSGRFLCKVSLLDNLITSSHVKLFLDIPENIVLTLSLLSI